VASAGFTALTGDTRSRKEALGQARYCTRIRGDRGEVSRYQGETDYSAKVLRTFERFKQGAVKDYRIVYRMADADGRYAQGTSRPACHPRNLA
jgi:hypothetical protein